MAATVLTSPQQLHNDLWSFDAPRDVTEASLRSEPLGFFASKLIKADMAQAELE